MKKLILNSSLALTFFILFISSISLTSCNRNTVELESFSPSGEVPLQTSISFVFNKDISPPKKLDQWLNEEFIKFDPAISGQFKWTSANTLLFSPSGSLLPEQDYKARITDKVLFNTKLKSDFEKLQFHTPDFKVEKADFFWTQIPKSSYQVSVQANLIFNYPVVPDQLRNQLEVYKEGQRVTNFEIVTKETSNTIGINFGEAQQTDKEQDYKLVIKKGLSSVYKRKPLKDDKVMELSLAPITELNITEITSGFETDAGWIEVGTTQMVDKDFLQKYVSLNPDIKTEFTVTPNSFRIEGSFNAGDEVNVKITKGLPGLYGGSLKENYEQSVLMANIDPYIRFSDKGGKYLMHGGQKNVTVDAVNIPEAEVQVYEVFRNNILFFLQNNSYGYYYGDEYYDDYYGNSYSVENFGKELWKDKIKLSNSQNKRDRFTVNLNKALGQRFKGIYVVRVNSALDMWRQDSKIISISDLGIISKVSGNEMLIFVNSIATTNPVEGVKVELVSTNNQTLVSANTDANGFIHIKNLKEQLGDFEPRLLMAQKDDDFNYLDMQETFVETSRFDVGGKAETEEGLDAFMYSERNLYRPGENMHLSAILRNANIEPTLEIPLLVKLIDPSGRTVQEWKKNTNQQGSFELAYNIPQYLRTGSYVYELYTGSNQLISSYKFSVEEFAPDKIRVDLKQNKTQLLPGEEIKIDVNSKYLFGSPASRHKYETDINFTHQPYTSKRFPDINFSNHSFYNSKMENYVMEGNLDENGNAEISYKIPDSIRSGGVVKATALVSVFDVTGRSVARAAEFNIYPKNYFIGIKSEGEYAATGADVRFKLAAVDSRDNSISAFQTTAELIRFEWHTVLRKNQSDRYYYTSEKEEITEWRRDVVLNGVTNYNFKLMRGGSYELRVYKKGDKDYVKTNFYAWGGNVSSASSFEMNKDGNIEVKTDKLSYSPGETAKILFRTPFSGKMLVTLERNKVFEHQYIEVKNNVAELSMKVGEGQMPNLYISATLFKKHTIENTSPFLVGHGYASIKIEKQGNKLPVNIIAPEKIKPRTKQEIIIKTAALKDVFVTLAAVDEGILQIKNYVTPDPYNYMYAKRQLSVKSYDLYKFLLPEMVSLATHTGGDGGFEMIRKRSTPITADRFKLVSFWSGIKRSNANGEVKVVLDIPQFNGEIRLMAVAYHGQKFGSAEKPMTVSNDVLIMPALPRFLSQNDELQIPVTVMNTTNRSGNVQVKMNIQSPLAASSGLSQNISVGAKESKVINFSVRSGKDIGVAKINFESSGMEIVREETELAVRPISPLVKETGSGIVKAGENINIQLPSGFLTSTQSTSIKISKFPALVYADKLQRLIGYPYGCLEQTVSKAFPQLYFEDLAALAAPEAFKGGNPVYYVKEAIRKVESMQQPEGGISYWPGESLVNYWGSVFAAHFLVEAQKAGYEVNKTKLDNLLDYLQQMATKKETKQYMIYNGLKWETKTIASKENVYALYVLALAKRGDLSLMNFYRSKPDLLSKDEVYLLAGAYALMNRWSMYHSLIPKAFIPEIVQRETGNTFDSEIRANALMLNILLEVDPSNSQIPIITKYLARNIGNFYSTQDMSWGIMALGKAAKANANSNIKMDIKADGKTFVTYDNKNLDIKADNLNEKNVTLSASGIGQVYYYWVTEGIKVNAPVKLEDAEIRVRRTFYDRTGKQITNNTFTQGQLVVCKISLESISKSASNIVISDLVPAGFEIMNPRITNLSQQSWIPTTNRMYPEHIDIRDDRLLLFTSIGARQKQDFYYMLRVINKGEFQLPAIGAEAMYDPEFHSYHGEGKVIIKN